MAKFLDTAFSLGKVALKSRKAGVSMRKEKGGRLVIMGNGPSLANCIASDSESLLSQDTMAVNFAANTPEFFRLCPRHYVLADPHFFSDKDENVKKLWGNLQKADWPITLHIPARAKVPEPTGATIQHFNMTPAEGYDAVCHTLYAKALAMPRPRNVLIPALMEGIRDGYEEIFIVGADHTWPHSLYVDEANRVVTVQPHFYKEDPKELERIAEVYSSVRIHDILQSMAVAFRSYHLVEAYAKKKGVAIFNSTPGSLIDAFTRKPLR